MSGPHTVMTRNSLFGRSASLICLTATVSPVLMFKARKTEPKAPFPRQSPSCYTPSVSAPTSSEDGLWTYIVSKFRILTRPWQTALLPRFSRCRCSLWLLLFCRSSSIGLLNWGAWVDEIRRLRSDRDHFADTAPISSFASRSPNIVHEMCPWAALNCHQLPRIRVQRSSCWQRSTSGHWQVM